MVCFLFWKRVNRWVSRHFLPRIEDVMSKPIITVETDTSIMEIIHLMHQKRLGSVIVTKDDKPAGIFTRRDLLRRVLMKNASLTDIKVGNVMSTPIMTVNARDQVIKAVENMKKKALLE